MPYWFTLFFALSFTASDAVVFPHLGVDGSPVRWEQRAIKLQVSQPVKNDLNISQRKLFELCQRAADVFNNGLGVMLHVQMQSSRGKNTQEDGINEIVLKKYPPCTADDFTTTARCNDENRFAHTQIYSGSNDAGVAYRPITEADIELNIDAFKSVEESRREQILLAVITHEIGHLLGLSHTCVASKWYSEQYKGNPKPPICDAKNPAHTGALMYPSLLQGAAPAITPNEAEWAFLTELYPAIESTPAAEQEGKARHVAVEVVVGVFLALGLVLWVLALRGIQWWNVRRLVSVDKSKSPFPPFQGGGSATLPFYKGEKGLSFLFPLFGALLTALLGFAAVPGIIDSRMAGLFALIPLYVALKNQSWIRGLLLGWVAGAAINFSATFWVIQSSQDTFETNLVTSVGILLLISLYQGLHYGVATLAHAVFQKRVPSWLSFSLCFGAADALFPHLFPASHVLFLHSATLLLQTADIAGYATVTFCIAAINAALADAVVSFSARGDKRDVLKKLLPAVIILIAMLAYGAVRIYQVDEVVRTAPAIHVAVIQPGTFPEEAQAHNDALIRKHIAMSKKAVARNKVDLLVWSESILNTAVPKYRLQRTLKQMFNGLNTPVLLGIPIMRPIEDGEQSHYNSAVLAKPDGWVCPDCRYDKNVLFPVGEQFVSAQNSATDSKTIAADHATDIQFQGHSIATYICFEALVPNYVRQLAKDAELLINPSYDGWFGDTAEAPIHEALSRVRAIENRKPLVRAAMSGISTIVDPVGRIVQRAGVKEERILDGRVTFIKERTIYSVVGNWPWWGALSLLLLLRAMKRMDRF